ncbi:glycosyltransferase family 4 protein [bacterium]|nr:glycosyltransferase family 4 protein [bacterium]
MADPRPIHILVVRYGSDPVTFLNRLLRGLANDGIRVTVAADRKSRRTYFNHENIDLLWAPLWEGSIFKKAINLFQLLFTRFSYKRIRWLSGLLKGNGSNREKLVSLYQYLPFMKGQWDLIYFPWNGSAVDYLGLFNLGIPSVISCRGSQINIKPLATNTGLYVNCLAESFGKATVIHCVSQDILNQALGYGLDPRKAVVIHPAVDPNVFPAPNEHRQNPRFSIVTTGSLIWRKGYEPLLMAFRKLLDSGIDAILNIIGTGEDQQRILYTIEDLDLKESVLLHGRLSPDQVSMRLKKADVFVLSSMSEGISNAVLEAMSCGLPIVTTDCGGMREAVEDGIEGFVVPIWDDTAMADKLRRLALDEDLRVRMGTAGRKRILAAFRLDQQITDFKELIYKAALKTSL